jgi:hypothetical protein
LKPIQQRRNQCSIAALCVLNNMTQSEYDALADLISGQIEGYVRKPEYMGNARKAIEIAKSIGLQVPQDYLKWRHEELFPSSPGDELQGKGIAWVKIAPGTHVLAYENGRLVDSNGKAFDSWEEYRIYYKQLHKRIKLIKTFPL